MFKLKQERDLETNKLITIGAHNCKSHSLQLTLYMRTVDWVENVDRQLTVIDKTTGEKSVGNNVVKCTSPGA